MWKFIAPAVLLATGIFAAFFLATGPASALTPAEIVKSYPACTATVDTDCYIIDGDGELFLL